MTMTLRRMKKRELTTERRAELSEELAGHVRESARLKEHKKTWMKATNEAIHSREESALALAVTLDQGYEEMDAELES